MSGLWPDGGMQRVACLVLGGMSLSSFAVQGQVDGSAAEVEAREIAFAKTMADHDLDAFLSFVSPEAIFFNGNDPLRGRDPIERGWARFFEGPDAPFS